MTFPNIFSNHVSEEVIIRINSLKPDTIPDWGKMNAAKMLAHCCVAYEMVYEDKHPKPNFLMKFILKSFVKKMVTGEAPYKRNSQTAPAFVIKDDRNFENEKSRLVNYIVQTKDLGEKHFDGKESHSFGSLTTNEWNTMFYKHHDHHLTQFGV